MIDIRNLSDVIGYGIQKAATDILGRKRSFLATFLKDLSERASDGFRFQSHPTVILPIDIPNEHIDRGIVTPFR